MRRVTLIVLAACACLACDPVPDPIVQAFGEQPLELPPTFENWSRAERFIATDQTRTLALQAYGADSLIPFAYGDSEITGFAIPFETEFEAQRRHQQATAFVGPTSSVSSTASETVSDYDGRFYFDSENPILMFHIRSHTIHLWAVSNGVSRTSSFRRALAFAEQIFDLNNLLDTQPLRPFQLDPVAFLPSNTEPILPQPTRFELDVAYILEGRPAANVSAQVRWFKAGRGLLLFSDSTRVQRGTGQVKFNWDVDLSDAILSDILVIRAHMSYSTSSSSGTVTVPTTSLMDPIRYSIARVNN